MREQLEALIASWPDDRGDPPDTDYQRGYMAACEEHARELRRVLTADAGEWRNMDSAPRDGTFVLLWVPADERSDGYCEVGSWVRSAGYWDIGTAQQPDSMFSHWHPEPPPPGARP